MTPPPQKEYIITEEDIQILEDSFGVTLIMPRSRPAPSIKNPCKDIGYCDVCENINCKHSKVSITAIRNATLDELSQYTKRQGFVRYDDKGRICNYTYINPKRLLQKIESLRTQEHP